MIASLVKRWLSRTSAGLSISAAGDSHVGLVRSVNQDAVLVEQQLGLFIVCDGLGGHAGGAQASQLAVETIAAGIEIGGDLRESIRRAHRAVQQLGRDLPSGERHPATTVVALLVRQGRWQLIWVGDSRCWLFTGKKVAQLTTDHTVVQQMVNWGDLSPEEARSHPERHKLSQALGLGSELVLGEERGPLEPGQRFLLATDGLAFWDEPERLQQIVMGGMPDIAVRRLLEASLAAGGRDNISCIIAVA